MFSRHPETGAAGRRSHASDLPGHVLMDGPVPARACGRLARPTVKVVMLTAAAGTHPAHLWLFRHDYRVPQGAGRRRCPCLSVGRWKALTWMSGASHVPPG